MKSNKYWEARRLEEIASFTQAYIEDINSELAVLYAKSEEKILYKMQALIDSLAYEQANGRELSISDLYQLDRYYKMLAQISKELKSLGKKELEVLDKNLLEYAEEFQLMVDKTYNLGFAIIDKPAAEAIVERVWAPDGKQYSSRVWEDKAKFLNVLEQGLFNVIVAGESNTKLAVEIKNIFSKEYVVAKRLVNTEITYIQTATALDRYKKSGFTQYRYYTMGDDKVCPNCEELDGKEFRIAEAKVGYNCPPRHP